MSTISYVSHKEQQYAVSGTVEQATRDCPRLKLRFWYSSLCKSLSVADCKVMLTNTVPWSRKAFSFSFTRPTALNSRKTKVKAIFDLS